VNGEGITSQSADSEDNWPATKPPSEFTGVAFEIIGMPHGIHGELLYRNGRFTGAHSVSPPFESLPPSKFPKITAAKQIAWFNLTRKNQIANPSQDQSASRQESAEACNRATAESLGRDFAEAMLEGRLSAFIKQITRAEKAEQKRQRDRSNHRKTTDGFRDALTATAWRCSHPLEVTKSAVLDFLKSDSGFCKSYGLTASMLNAREVRRQLESLGFGWLPDGRKRGRPPTK
jgi:hypothetical protein